MNPTTRCWGYLNEVDTTFEVKVEAGVLREPLLHLLVPRLDLRHAALEVPVAGKHRFLQLERFRIEAPRFFERLVDARHYRLGPTSRSCPRVG